MSDTHMGAPAAPAPLRSLEVPPGVGLVERNSAVCSRADPWG